MSGTEHIIGFRFLFMTGDPEVAVVRIPKGGLLSGESEEWVVHRGDYKRLIDCKSGLLKASRYSSESKQIAEAVADEVDRWFYPWKS